MELSSPLQLWVWGWPGQVLLAAHCNHRREKCHKHLLGRQRCISSVCAHCVSLQPPNYLYTLMSGAAPWHEGRLLRLPWVGNSPFKTQFFLLCPSALVSPARHGWWCFKIFQLPNSHGMEAYLFEQAIAPPWWFWWTWGFSLVSWILGVQNAVDGSISCLIISCGQTSSKWKKTP